MFAKNGENIASIQLSVSVSYSRVIQFQPGFYFFSTFSCERKTRLVSSYVMLCLPLGFAVSVSEPAESRLLSLTETETGAVSGSVSDPDWDAHLASQASFVLKLLAFPLCKGENMCQI